MKDKPKEKSWVFVRMASIFTPIFSALMYSADVSLGNNLIISCAIFVFIALQPTDHVDFD
jgi:hypothetical protein